MEHINQKFNILSALGIILVVGGHCGFNFIHQFPVYSFHMPLFIFISGYFFHAYDFRTFLSKKVKHLLVPFLLWNVFYGCLINWLAVEGWTRIGHAPLNFKSLLWDPFTTGWPFAFNGPAWFVGTLFVVQILYWGIHRIWGTCPLITGGVVSGGYLLSLYLTFHGWSSFLGYAGIGIERALFFLPFYYLGGIYKIRVEKAEFSLNKTLMVVVLCFAINLVLLHFWGKNLIFYNVHHMDFPARSYWLPFITACTGIFLYLQFAEFIVHKIKHYEILEFIGRHTYSIMMHHQFFFWLVNTVFFLLWRNDINIIPWFNYEKYMMNLYYRIETPYRGESYVYLAIGLLGPLLFCWIYDKWIQKTWERLIGRIVKVKNRKF